MSGLSHSYVELAIFRIASGVGGSVFVAMTAASMVVWFREKEVSFALGMTGGACGDRRLLHSDHLRAPRAPHELRRGLGLPRRRVCRFRACRLEGRQPGQGRKPVMAIAAASLAMSLVRIAHRRLSADGLFRKADQPPRASHLLAETVC
jgi:hypothetical protein